MSDAEAIETCERWLAYLDRKRDKSNRIQQLAQLARCGPVWQHVAKRALGQIDQQPTVFDGATLEPAVRHIIAALGESV